MLTRPRLRPSPSSPSRSLSLTNAPRMKKTDAMIHKIHEAVRVPEEMTEPVNPPVKGRTLNRSWEAGEGRGGRGRGREGQGGGGLGCASWRGPAPRVYAPTKRADPVSHRADPSRKRRGARVVRLSSAATLDVVPPRASCRPAAAGTAVGLSITAAACGVRAVCNSLVVPTFCAGAQAKSRGRCSSICARARAFCGAFSHPFRSSPLQHAHSSCLNPY